MTHTAEQFLDAILAEPESDTPRLIFADWLDEQVAPTCTSCTGPGRVLDSGNEWKPHPDCKRCRGTGRVPDKAPATHAEFIRVQVELAALEPVARKHAHGEAWWEVDCPECNRFDALRRRERELIGEYGHEWAGPALPFRGQFRRGFVAEVTLTAEEYCGGVCGRCDGRGYYHSTVTRDTRRDHPCPACKGDKRTPGVAGALFRSQPIEKVTLSGNVIRGGPDGVTFWTVFRGSGDGDLPPELFALLGHECCHDPGPEHVGAGTHTHYSYRADAEADVSQACVLYGRAAAKEGK